MNFDNDERLIEKNISRERVFNGLIFNVDRLVNELPNGKVAKRDITTHNGASAVIPVDDDGNIYLVRQFRVPLEKVLMEIPAGKLDSPDEDPLLGARRELKEETGLNASEWTKLTCMYSTPGFSNEFIAIYLARNLSFGDCHPDEDEFLNVVKMPFEKAYQMCVNGEISDAKSIIGICLAKAHLSDA